MQMLCSDQHSLCKSHKQITKYSQSSDSALSNISSYFSSMTPPLFAIKVKLILTHCRDEQQQQPDQTEMLWGLGSHPNNKDKHKLRCDRKTVSMNQHTSTSKEYQVARQRGLNDKQLTVFTIRMDNAKKRITAPQPKFQMVSTTI